MYLPTYSTIGQTPVLQELPRVARVVLTRDARWKGGGGGRGKGRERFKGNGGFRDSESRNFLTVIFFFFFLFGEEEGGGGGSYTEVRNSRIRW